MTYVRPAWEFAVGNHLLKLQRLQNKVLVTTGNFPRRTHLFAICTRLSNFHSYMIIQQNDAGNKHKSCKKLIIKMFETADKVSPDTGEA
jgi:hypothetical protein